MVVRVHAAAINPADYKVFANIIRLPFLRWLSFQSPAYDAAGVVVETNCSPPQHEFEIGQRVFGNVLGGLQEYAIMLCNRAGRIKAEEVTFAQAAASVTVMFTALTALHEQEQGAVVMILGASGGCGQAAIAVAKLQRAASIICLSSDAQSIASRCTHLYAPHELPTMRADWHGKVDVVFDAVSSDWHNAYFAELEPVLRVRAWRAGLDRQDYIVLSPVFDKLLWHADAHARMRVLSAEARPEYIQIMEEQGAVLFPQITLASVSPAFNTTNVERGFALLRSHRAHGKIVFSI